jgi:hypothetical protein
LRKEETCTQMWKLQWNGSSWNIMGWCETHSFGSEYWAVTGSYEHGNELSGSVEGAGWWN